MNVDTGKLSNLNIYAPTYVAMLLQDTQFAYLIGIRVRFNHVFHAHHETDATLTTSRISFRRSLVISRPKSETLMVLINPIRRFVRPLISETLCSLSHTVL